MYSLTVIVFAALYGLSGADTITKVIVPLLGVLGGAAAGRFGRKKVEPTIKSLLESNAMLAAALEASQARERAMQKEFQAIDKEYQNKLRASLEREEGWRRKFFRLEKLKTGEASLVGQIAATTIDPEA